MNSKDKRVENIFKNETIHVEDQNPTIINNPLSHHVRYETPMFNVEEQRK